MNYDQAIARVYEQLASDHVENALMECLRIARGLNDYLQSAIFLRELYPERRELARMMYDDASHLNAEQLKFLSDKSLDRWLEIHTVETLLLDEDHVDDPGEKRNVLKIGIGEIDGGLQQWERTIADMVVPPGMTPFDAAAFTDRFTREKASIRLRMNAMRTIKARLKSRCLNYAIQIERQISLQRRSQGFLEVVQNDVNNFFKARSDEVYTKLAKATELATSTDVEDSALVLTEVRRALKSAADFFYPPKPGMTTCADGVERALGDEQYLNRLQEFLARRLARSTSRDLLRAELDHLAAFMRRLNEVASKGVHSLVTLEESKQGLVGLYFFLFNVCQHLVQDVDS